MQPRPKRKYNTRFLLTICGVAALGGILFGYDTSVISGAISSISIYFKLTSLETGWAVSNVVIGCIVGAFYAGRLATRYGRKMALIIAAILFTISAVGAALAPDFFWFVVYRMIGGVAVGIASTVSPMYMSEVSPKDFRGRAVSMQQFAIVFGQIIIFYVNYEIARHNTPEWLIDLGWRWMIGSETIPCLLFLFFVLFIPESPRWNVMMGREDAALKMLTRLSNPEHAKNLLREIKDSLSSLMQKTKSKADWSNRDNRYILIIACVITGLQQVTGVNVMMYYAPMVLEQVTGGNANEALFQTIWIGVAQLAGVVVGVFLFDRMGRLPLMRIGTLGAIFGLLLTSIALYIGSTGYFALFGMVLFMIFFAFSWGTGCWLLVSEIFPNDLRAQGMGIAVCFNWIGNFLVSQSFPMINDQPWLKETFHGAFPMWIFAGCCVVCYWFIVRYIPETKGVSLERMREVVLAKRDKKAVAES